MTQRRLRAVKWPSTTSAVGVVHTLQPGVYGSSERTKADCLRAGEPSRAVRQAQMRAAKIAAKPPMSFFGKRLTRTKRRTTASRMRMKMTTNPTTAIRSERALIF